MISPDYFDSRWSWYRPVLNRQEQPRNLCTVEVRRLPIRFTTSKGGEYIPFAVQADVDKALTVSLRRLQDYAIRYMVKGEKVSAHTLPQMNDRVRAMVSYLRKQNPHLSRDMLHHWCAESQGAAALLNICEVLWEQGWKQDQADSAPWVPAVNVLLLRLIRTAIAKLSGEESATVNHVMLCVVGGLYNWALQGFLKRYLEGVVEIARIPNCEAMVLPVTPMVFMHHQPDSTLLADDSRIIRAYGLEPEIVPQMRYLIGKVGNSNEGGMLALLAKDRMGAHLLRRSWARLSLWKLALKTGYGGWMRWVLDAKRLDQLLAGQVRLDSMAMENLHANSDEAIAVWLQAQMQGGRSAKAAGEPWLQDKITLVAFRVFDEDVRVEIARREAECCWLDRKSEMGTSGRLQTGLVGISELRGQGGLRGGRDSESEKRLEQAWLDGELVLVQSDAGKMLHSGKSMALHHGCMRVEWSDYLAHIYTLSVSDAAQFLSDRFLPAIFEAVESRGNLFLDACSGSGCMLRGSVVELTEAALFLRERFRQLYLEVTGQQDGKAEVLNIPPVSMCMDLTGEWIFGERQHAKMGEHRIAFSLAVSQVDAGISRDTGIARMINAGVREMGKKSLGSVNVEKFYISSDEAVQVIHNAGIALTASALKELTKMLAGSAHIHEYRRSVMQVRGVLDDYRLPPAGLEMVVIRRHGEEGKCPWLLVKVGKPNLAGVDVEVYELLDEYSDAAQNIVALGLKSW
ncbi:hypothetical protein Ga0123462_0270 [Mariprofundus ferrinatatus]|uniref:Uncharacterized protein n=1 Tax=Mariprofundus ferrinatatus TaxID=1921087 RepID=A0A2K8L1F0_9PROT|nr:hypothetical protein [Mariprofundus ferrinatatus]ATX81145.1 hypothetical protein Ga0123462_0270 [Mariprofundus ferrinatatus]